MYAGTCVRVMCMSGGRLRLMSGVLLRHSLLIQRCRISHLNLELDSSGCPACSRYPCLYIPSSKVIGKLPSPPALMQCWELNPHATQEAFHPPCHFPNPRHEIFLRKKFNCKVKIYYNNYLEKETSFTFIKYSEMLKNKAIF